jgi:hypothetical protein
MIFYAENVPERTCQAHSVRHPSRPCAQVHVCFDLEIALIAQNSKQPQDLDFNHQKREGISNLNSSTSPSLLQTVITP